MTKEEGQQMREQMAHQFDLIINTFKETMEKENQMRLNEAKEELKSDVEALEHSIMQEIARIDFKDQE